MVEMGYWQFAIVLAFAGLAGYVWGWAVFAQPSRKEVAEMRELGDGT
jgi:hypothetical protein